MPDDPYLIVAFLVTTLGLSSVLASAHRLRLPIGFDIALAAVLVLFAGLRGASLDYEEYVIMFDTIRASSGASFLDRAIIGKDLLFGTLIVVLTDMGFENFVCFLAAAFISVSAKVVAYRTAFGTSITALMIYFFAWYFLHDFTQIRAAIAISICYCAFVFLLNKQTLRYLILSLVAIGFHGQAALFVIVTFPLLKDSRYKFHLMAVVVGVLVISAPVVMKLVLSFDERPGIDATADELSMGAIAAAVMNSFLILFAYLASHKNIKRSFERELSKASLILVFSGVAFLFSTFSVSVGLAWRSAEMLMSFGVFVIVSALRSGVTVPVLFSSTAYAVLIITLLLRGHLLVDYRFAETFGRCCERLW